MPSVAATPNAVPLGEKRTHVARTSRSTRRELRSPFLAPGTESRNASSLSLSPMSMPAAVPASVRLLVWSLSRTPSSERLWDSCHFLSSSDCEASYRQMNFELPPARMQTPSAVYAMLLKHLPYALDCLGAAGWRQAV